MEGENVEIVKMDATANDVPPGFDVRGFPTLYWLPKDKKPVQYQVNISQTATTFCQYSTFFNIF